MDDILSALDAIRVADLSREDWIKVGMVLKHEGYTCNEWDSWSRADARYKSGECERKWNSFKGNSDPVTGATIVQMAKERGWTPQRYEGDGALDWSDQIEYDGGVTPKEVTPAEELTTYISLLFDRDDYIGYVTSDVWQDKESGKYLPGKGVYRRTAGDILDGLKKHPDDIGAVIGDWKEEAGAWIRFNALDGKGVNNDNVAKFKYALVESDTLPIAEQDKLFRKLRLPIAVMVHSGGKSLHAIVRVDAKDYDEYKERVQFLYDFLGKHGVEIDKQNKNPSRLSRMPGVTRNGNRQHIAATNIGLKSWREWVDFADGVLNPLPEVETFGEVCDNLEPPPPPLIDGILRCGHKMLIAGASKAGKSFLLLELAIAIAEGREWLGHSCKQGRVLYVNLEIDGNSFKQRISAIYKAMALSRPDPDKLLDAWTLRGRAMPLDKLITPLIRQLKSKAYIAVIIDPIYKIITGDENNASEMSYFCNQFDKICTETGCATIYCHHHSKGAQGAKRVADRASGSGVFARDPDAQLDLTELVLTDYIKNTYADSDNATAFRVESSLREFANIKPVDVWFEYPLHVIDESGVLSQCGTEGSPEGNLQKSPNYSTEDERRDRLEIAFDACAVDGIATVKDIAEYLNKSERTIKRSVDEYSEKFTRRNGAVMLRVHSGQNK